MSAWQHPIVGGECGNAVADLRAALAKARVQRWFRHIETAPRDGTVFIMPVMARYTEGQLEQLYVDPEEDSYYLWSASRSTPRWWCPLLPRVQAIPENVPTADVRVFEVSVSVKRRSLLGRCLYALVGIGLWPRQCRRQMFLAVALITVVIGIPALAAVAALAVF